MNDKLVGVLSCTHSRLCIIQLLTNGKTTIMPYAVYVDKNNTVWLSDFGTNAIVRFDPIKEKFNVVTLSTPGATCPSNLGKIRRNIGKRVWSGYAGSRRIILSMIQRVKNV